MTNPTVVTSRVCVRVASVAETDNQRAARAGVFVFVLGILALLVAAETAQAKWPPLRLLPAKREGDPPPAVDVPVYSSPQARLHNAGHPERIAPWARPSETPAYDGYYVGGSAPLWDSPLGRGKSRPRSPYEGTFGWDYFGSRYRRRVDLQWLPRYRQHRHGVEAYKTDGPHLLKKE